MDPTVLLCLLFAIPFATSHKILFETSNEDFRNLPGLHRRQSMRKSRSPSFSNTLRELQEIPTIESMLPEGYNLKNLDKYHYKEPEPGYIGYDEAFTQRRNVRPDLKASINFMLNKIRRRQNLQKLHEWVKRRTMRNKILIPEEFGSNFKTMVKMNKRGDSLIQSFPKTLKSASNYPNNKEIGVVYGNEENLGLRYNDSRVKYSDFRKRQPIQGPNYRRFGSIKRSRKNLHNNKSVLSSQLSMPEQTDPFLSYGSKSERYMREAIKRRFKKVPSRRSENFLLSNPPISNSKRQLSFNEISEKIMKDIRNHAKISRDRFGTRKTPYYVQVVISPSDLVTSELLSYKPLQDYLRAASMEDQNISFESDLSNEYYSISRRKYYNNCTNSSEYSSTDSGSGEKNPGNPYTVWKNKYKQNWMWNHGMGDHMNVNPWAPTFNTLGPSAAELFFGRKWWYYNQDDFKPFR